MFTFEVSLWSLTYDLADHWFAGFGISLNISTLDHMPGDFNG